MQFKVPKHSFDSADLDVIERAYDSICNVLDADSGLRGKPGLDDLKAKLKTALFALACVDFKDAETLRDRALANLSVQAGGKSYEPTPRA
jgi:hypothetical protein